MIIKENVWITPYQCDRLLHIYLPDDIQENETFPVLYMFDGHNLFFDEDATYGKCWGLKDYLLLMPFMMNHGVMYLKKVVY